MSKISKDKIERIKGDILFVLYEAGLNAKFTKEISDEVIRDKEFVLNLLRELERDHLVRKVGDHKIRKKWVMSNEAYKKYDELYKH